MGRSECPKCGGTLNSKELPNQDDKKKADRAYAMVCNKCSFSPYAIDPLTNKLIYRNREFLNYE